jgi:hypothetical protein
MRQYTGLIDELLGSFKDIFIECGISFYRM